MGYLCPVCGYPGLNEYPHSYETGGSYEICPSCGYQFGVTDDDLGISYEDWRRDWISKGMPWNSVGIEMPIGWDPIRQLESVS